VSITFSDLKESLLKLNSDIKSNAVEFFFEAVYSRDVFEQLETCLESYFGKPLKPPQQLPTPESDAFAGRYGGAKEGQTLYVLKRNGSHADIALIWPWSSGQQFTVKLIRQ